MSWVLEVHHVTTYRYANPVEFGEHRLMFRPRSGHDNRVLDASVTVSPNSDIHWVFDVFSNSVTVITPRYLADELRIDCAFRIANDAVQLLDLPVEPRASRIPFDYEEEERRDLGALLDPHYPDPEGLLFEWTQQFFPGTARRDAREMLIEMAGAIKNQFRYVARDSEGTQTPDETLRLMSGSCRDYALLMMEAVRRLGIAARFVSGYLYDPAVDGGEGSVIGAGATHAWMQAYLPGAGWVPFDPTNEIVGGPSLIRVAVARDPSQAAPLSGTWYGAPSDYLGMDVDVSVRRRWIDEAHEHIPPAQLGIDFTQAQEQAAAQAG
jgi:transglutaminase-like putative cysteine protease